MLKPRKRLVKSKIKEDKLITYTVKSQAYAKENWKTLGYGIVAVIIIIVAIGMFSISKRSAETQSTFDEMMARDAYARGEFEETLTRIDGILEEYSNTNSAASALMLKGRIFQQSGDHAAAEEAYREVARKFSHEEYLCFGANISLAVIARGREDFSLAADKYLEAASKFPGHFNSPVALFEAGTCLEKISKYDEAKRAYSRILKDYPKSRSADKARNNLADIEFMG